MSEIEPALLTRLELEWILGKRSNLPKKTERDLRYRISKKVRIFMHTELPTLKDKGFAAALGNDAAVTNSGCTVRSSKADSRVAPDDTISKPKSIEVYDNRMLRPGFEPGISDSKGRYA
jgi:hypothetical protein